MKKDKNQKKKIKKENKIIKKIKDNKYLKNQFVQTLLLSMALNIVIESLGRKAILGGFIYILNQPLVFLLNTIIIFASLSLTWFFKRRVFVTSLISALWLVIGLANGIILQFRMTPFTTADLSLLEAGIDILPNYLNPFEIGLLIGLLLLVVAGFIALFIFAPKCKDKINYKKTLAKFIVVIIVLSGGMTGGVKIGVVSTYFGNLWDAYTDYGVPYCFLNTWLNKGISRPPGYSEEAIKGIFKNGELDTMTSKATDKTEKDFPNIIFLQLESFMDPYEVKGMKLSEDPVPYFRELKKNYSSGHLEVPSVGGGTANTEFAIMTGMNLKFFGPGEYPYKSVLKKEVCESMAYDLKNLGYSAHALHNHRGAFYNRNTVFANLGFDSYTSVEYMNYVSKTPRNWARDEVLTNEITNALKSTKNKDYIYAISVQGHGEYPQKRVLSNPKITVESFEDNPKLKYGYEYYVSQINEMDDFLRDLTARLEDFDEDIVLVMYGDHLPALDMTDQDMKSGNTYNTEYVIWSNFGLKKEDKELKAYQLSAEVQKRIGMREGSMTVFHQDYAGKKNYKKYLKMLQYDVLYGAYFLNDGVCPFEPVDMTMGYNPIKIFDIVEIGGEYYIRGKGFTPFSKVSIGDKVLDTMYLEPTLLKLREEVKPSDVEKMKVSQVEKNKEILSTTE